MVDDKLSHTSGKANYEQYITTSSETTSSSEEQKFQDKTATGYESKDFARYQINKPKRDIIYAKIVRQEQEKPCITSQETKTTD